MDTVKKIGLRIRELRMHKGQSQEKLAFEAHITAKHLSSIELGKENPTLSTLLRLAGALKVELWEMLNYGHVLSEKELQKKLLGMLKTLKEEDARLVLKFLNTIVK